MSDQLWNFTHYQGKDIKRQKCAGISGLWVLNEIIHRKNPENMKKIVGAVWKLPTLAISKFLCKENAGAILKALLISNE